LAPPLGGRGVHKKSTPLSAECLQNDSHSNIIPFGDTGKLFVVSVRWLR
jgi:hypothetical protein